MYQLLDILSMAAMFAVGCAWQYTNLHAKFRRGCGDFMGVCVQLVMSGDFDERNVAIAFHQNMPWQGHVVPELLDRLQ